TPCPTTPQNTAVGHSSTRDSGYSSRRKSSTCGANVAHAAAAPPEPALHMEATMDTDTTAVAAQLAGAFDRTATAEARRRTWHPRLRLLAPAHPATAEQLAAATNRTVDEARAALPTLPSIELDEHRRVIGSGITLRPTPHRFTVNGHQLYTWCALDT